MFIFLAACVAASGQRLLVTAEAHPGKPAEAIQKDDVSVEVDKKPAALKEWIPLRGNQADLELYVVIDDGEDTDLGIQFASLKAFIKGQPATTRIGLAYLRNGSANIAAPLTADHAQVSNAIRLPLGEAGIAASPYIGISDLVKKWPENNARREILLISNGVDPYAPHDPLNPYMQKAIADCQRAGIPVHSIYYSGGGHFGHSYSRMNWGQDYLSEIGDATGGEAYWQGTSNPVSFDPFLRDLTDRLLNQYLAILVVNGSHGGLEPVRVHSMRADTSLTSASMIHLMK